MDDKAICSQCRNEVKQGYIFSPHRIFWTESGKPVFMDDGSEVLVKGPIFRMHKTPAYRCEGCKLVTFYYE